MIAEAAGAKVVRVNCRQIAAARNAGARTARGETLVFVDADTLIGADVVRAMIDALQAGAIGGGARVLLDEPVPTYGRILMPIVQRFNERVGIIAGCFLFCARSAFDSTGGFDERVYAAEEAFMSRALRRLGRLVFLKQTVVTSGRKLRTFSGSEIFRGILSLAVRGTRGVRSRKHLDLWYGPRREDPKQSEPCP